jgi:hypothetical protein
VKKRRVNRAFVATVKGRRNSLSPSRSVFKEREIRKRDKRLHLPRARLFDLSQGTDKVEYWTLSTVYCGQKR